MKVETEKGRVVGICEFCRKPVHAHKFKVYRNQYCHIKCFDIKIAGKIRKVKKSKKHLKKVR